jgi:hypothetical protein
MERNQDIPKDSVMRYSNLLDIDSNGTLYKHAAYDLLLHSGYVLMIKDRKRLTDISNCYADLEEIYNGYTTLAVVKREMMLSTLQTADFSDVNFNKPAWRQMRNFFVSFTGRIGYISETRKEIERVLGQRPK